MEVKSLQDFFVAHAIEVFNTLFSISGQELEKNIETKNIIEKIDPNTFYYTKSIDCAYDDVHGNIKISFSKKIFEILIHHIDDDIKGYYNQMDKNILLSNYMGILMHTPYRKLGLMCNEVDFKSFDDIPIMEIFKQNKILLFSKDNIPLVYLGVTFDN